MGGSSYGTMFRISTFGESHGGAVGVVVDGAAPGVELSEADIQVQLDRRKGGRSAASTPRAEPDKVHILSGVFEGKTTGTPILMVLYNEDARSSAYDGIKDLYRPGHADLSFQAKFGIRDWRGSGRASGRETAARVAAGALARKSLAARGVSLLAYTKRAAGIEGVDFDPAEIERNPLRAADAAAAVRMMAEVEKAKAEEDSVGGVVECRVSGVPAGLGEPVFDKLDAELAKAMLSIGAVKGIEFGAGFAAADSRGSRNNDWMDASGFLTNNAGGILGGISSGAEIVFRVAVKPTSSIASPQKTVGLDGAERIVRTEGRHDVCICPRIVPVVEAMACLVLEDFFKRQAANLA
jgi:chorismate synthase